ncbi:MAG TPA: 2'-5' RNA ligase family protein [Terriglobales bacterium]|nr:2'-5' RNA ligase family protein [Terriglobales bacterium]
MASETVLMVVVPEAEELVKPFRDAHDPSAASGAPAHITILYPFLPPERVDARVAEVLRRCCAAQAPIEFRLHDIRRFSPDHVLYLAPEPDEPFRQLTQAIWRLFPETPPYAGRHTQITPHLSVAWVQEAALMMRIAADFTAEASDRLPISARATALALFDNVSDRWHERQRFPFVGG